MSPARTERGALDALGTASIGVAALDEDGRIVGTSAALEALLGRSREELAGERLADHVDEPDRELDAALLAELESGGRRVYELDRRYLRAGGGAIFVRETVTRMTWTRGADRLVMIRELADRDGDVLAAQARDALVLLGHAAGIVSHEVRNALAGIRSAVEVIGGALPPAGIEAVAVREVRERIVELDRTVGELLSFARAPQIELVSAHALLADVAVELGASSLRVNGPDVEVCADAGQMSAALAELCGEGVKGAVLEANVERDGAAAVLRLSRGASARRSLASREREAQGVRHLLARRIIEAHRGELAIDPSAGVIVRLPAGAG